MAVVRERPILSGALLGLGFAAKLWPAVLLPIAVVHLWRRKGRRSEPLPTWARSSWSRPPASCPSRSSRRTACAAMFADQLNRPLQVESLGAAVLMAAQHLGMRPLHDHHDARGAGAERARSGARSRSVDSARSRDRGRDLDRLRPPPQPRRRDGAARSGCATVAALVAFDKVLSPQYLIWIVPFVPLVRGRARHLASGAALPRARPDADVVPAALLVARERPPVARGRGTCSRATSPSSRSPPAARWSSAADEIPQRERGRSPAARQAGA